MTVIVTRSVMPPGKYVLDSTNIFYIQATHTEQGQKVILIAQREIR